MIRVQTIWLQTAKWYIPLCCCFLLSIITNAQFSLYNLVPNPSFEQYNNCPTGITLYDIYNDKPDFWYKPDKRGARYFNACANGFNNNSNGMPVNFLGGGLIFNMPELGMDMLLCIIIMALTPVITFKCNY